MDQFSIDRLKPTKAGRHERLVVVLQHDALGELKSRLVAPRISGDEGKPLGKLTPRLTFDRQIDLIGLHQLAAVDRGALGPAIGRADVRDDVMRGIDLLLSGF